MHDGIFYIALIGYWLFFYRHLLSNPFLLAYGEGLDCDFPTQRLCGEYWRKGQIPKDPYYYGDLIGARMGILYPVNVLFSLVGSFLKIDHAWVLHVYNILLHGLATSILAYHMFGCGLIGLFGGLLWGYMGYHIKQNLWYVQTFTWITAVMCFLETGHFAYAGISIGMLILAGTPPLWIYFCILLIPYLLINHIYSPHLLWGVVIGFPQIIAYTLYRKVAVKDGDKSRGHLKPWIFLKTFLPLRIRDHLCGVGFEETAFYMTPLVLLAFTIHHWLWVMVMITFILSSGIAVKWHFRFPQRWGYFVCLGIAWITVDAVEQMALSNNQLILLTILLGYMLLYNRSLLPIWPFVQWIKKPSQYFETPVLKYLESKMKETDGIYKVNNLPYPVYSGQINHIHGLGYYGGNRREDLSKIRNIPAEGACGNNWFEFRFDCRELDRFGIKYHIGEKPRKQKWKQVEGFDNLWENTNLI